LGIPLIGSYGKPSDDVLDELYSKAIVLNDGDTTIAIVSSDLLYAPLDEITAPVRRIINEKAGIPEENILVCATHTHSGPEVFTRAKLGPEAESKSPKIDRTYLDTLVEKIASCVLIANKNMQPVKIGAAKGSAPELVFNRRPRNNEGLVKMAFTLPPEVLATQKIVTGSDGRTRVTFDLADEKTEWRFGPIDPEVRVLRIENEDGGIISSLVNFGCHPVTIYPSLSTSISADYPARATGVVEQAEGGLCLFALGLAGNAVPYERGVSPCRQIGRSLGGEAVRRLQFVTTSGDVTVKGLRKKVVFPAKKGQSADEGLRNIVTEFQVLRLGDIYILGLPGEVLVEVGLAIKESAGIDNLFIVTLSNDAIGYVCPAAAYDEGGYEPTGATDLAKGAGEIMVKEALGLIEQARQSQ